MPPSDDNSTNNPAPREAEAGSRAARVHTAPLGRRDVYIARNPPARPLMADLDVILAQPIRGLGDNDCQAGR